MSLPISDRVCDTCPVHQISLLLLFWDALKSATKARLRLDTALNDIGFAPAVTFFTPCRKIAWATPSR